MTKVIVTFEKNWRGYAAGETAGFEAGVAESLIKSDYAIEAGKPTGKKGKPGTGNAAATDKQSDGATAAEGAGKSPDQADAAGKP